MENDDMRRSYFTAWIVNCQVTEPIQPKNIYEGLHPQNDVIDTKTEAEMLAKQFHLQLGDDGKIIKEGKE